MKRAFFSRSPVAANFLYYNHASPTKWPHNSIVKTFMIAGLLLAVLLAIYISTRFAYAVGPPVFTQIAIHPQASAQPTEEGKMLRDLAVNNGKLYAAYGDYNVNTGPIHINPFNLTSGAFEGSMLSVPTEAIYGFRSINGRLVAPMLDPTTPYTANQGYAEQQPDGSWQNRVHVPMEHVYDVATLDGMDLWMAGHRRASDGTELDAVAYRSTDGGATWTVAQTDATEGEDDEYRAFDRYYWMAVLNGKIYMQASLTYGAPAPVRSFDGLTWEEGTTTQVCGHDPGLVEVFAGHIVCTKGNWNSLQLYDGTSLSIHNLAVGQVTDFYVDQSYLYVLGSQGIYRTSNLQDWVFVSPQPNGAHSLAVVDDHLYIGTTSAAVLRSEDSITEILSAVFVPEYPLPGVVADSCFGFDSSTGTITTYYQHQNNNVADPPCPRALAIPSMIGGVDVVGIGGGAFYGKSLTALTLPDTLVDIGGCAFANNNIENLFIPDSITNLDGCSFDNNPLVSVTIGTDNYSGTPQLSIGSGNFSYIPTLKTVKIGNNVKEIVQGAFSYNNNLSELDLGDSIERLFASFSGGSITSLIIPDSVIEIGAAFTNHPLQSISLGTSDYKGSPHMVITAGFLQGVSTLQSMTFGNSVKEIDGGALAYLPNLTYLDLGESIQTIANAGAFYRSRIETVTLPKSLVSIGSSVFASSSIKTLIVQGNPTILGEPSAFLANNGLDSASVPTDIESAAIYRQNNAELVRVYAADPAFVAANSDSFHASCTGSWNGSSYGPPCYVTSGYLINPASVELRYVNSADTDLSTSRMLVSSTPSTVPDYKLIHILDTTDPDNQLLNFADGNYYRLGDTVELTSEDIPSIAGYVTPTLSQPLVLNASFTEQVLIYYTQSELDSINGSGALADTGISLWPVVFEAVILSSLGAFLIRLALLA